jgi:trehalose 2-sulfotransferase
VARDLSALLGHEYDTPAGRRPDSPARCYIVCSTPRSGSGLLCRALASATVAGTPTEYFNAANRAALAARWDCGADLDAYVATLRSRRTTAGGVFGTKLHWEQFEQLRAEALGLGRAEPEFEISAGLLDELFPAPLYIHIVRRDVNRQAISFWTALHTGVWSRPIAADRCEPSPLPYNFAGIDRCRRLIENAELHWDRFFRFNGIEPLDIVYEDLCAAYQGTVASVLRHIVPGAGEIEIGVPEGRRQGNGHFEALLTRFAQDRESRGLDNPLAPSAAEQRVGQLERALHTLTRSRSWRITRPLRAVRGAARRLA